MRRDQGERCSAGPLWSGMAPQRSVCRSLILRVRQLAEVNVVQGGPSSVWEGRQLRRADRHQVRPLARTRLLAPQHAGVDLALEMREDMFLQPLLTLPASMANKRPHDR
jgi:hypothetical protein